MRERQSYLESLNAGRPRRDSSSIDKLSATISGLERQIQNLQSGPRESAREAARPRASQQSSAHAGYSKASAAENQLLDVFTIELAKIRRDLADMRNAVMSAPGAGAFRDELARLHDRFDAGEAGQSARENAIRQLNLEIDDLKASIENLAREDSLRAIEARWNAFEDRWSNFNDSLIEKLDRRQPEAEVFHLAERLEQLQDMVARLPQNLPIDSLEEQIGVLARAVESLAGGHAPAMQADNAYLESIEQRLDEISRAIVASSVSVRDAGALDSAPFERIEARLSALAEQMEVHRGEAHAAPDTDRFNALSDRIEKALADMQAAPVPALDEIEERLDALRNRIEESLATPAHNTDAIASMLEERLAVIEERLSAAPFPADQSHGNLVELIEERMRALSTPVSLDNGSAIAQSLEHRLEAIASKLDSIASQGSDVDGDALLNLESQIASLSKHLSANAPDAEYGTISPRLASIEESITASRENVLDAARIAAENAVAAFAERGKGGEARGLADDLRQLEELTRRSDERNAKTFNAIHDTLLKIVDRLTTLEAPVAQVQPAAAKPRRGIPAAEMPALSPEALDDAPEFFDEPVAPASGSVSPAQAAAAAARAAVGEESGFAGKIGGLLSGVRRKSAKPAEAGHEHDLVASAEAAIPVLAGDPLPEADPDFGDEPIEPGKNAPDLNAIMRRVRDERNAEAAAGQKGKTPSTGSTDFLAAARRAAQAAAAEADVLKSESARSKGGSKFGSLGATLAARRKPIIMAAGAILLAVAGLQFGKSYLGGGEKPVAEAPKPAVTETASAKDVAIETPTAVRQVTPSPAPEAESANTSPVNSDADEVIAAAPEPDSDQPVAALPEPAQEESATDIPEELPTAIILPSDIGANVALETAAKSGDPVALFEVASRYAEGRGPAADPAKAFEWYKLSAELGYAPAQYRLGSLYEKGIGTERNIDQAKTWYQLAAGQGNASAMHNLAVLFAVGSGGTPDNESAAIWFQKAAELGVKDSQYNLGIMTAQGAGVPQNLEESYKWFALAAKAGDNDAAAKRDEVYKVLRPEQQERARATTELWKPKPIINEANEVIVPAEWTTGQEHTASVDMEKATRNLQMILNNNGYDAGPADGIMGGKTKTAISQFQKDNGLEVTGDLNDQTIKALLDKNS